MDVSGVIRRFPALRSLAEVPGTLLRLTGQLSLAMAQVEGEGCEESRAGRRFWWAPGNGITGQAAVQALPTTTAQWVIWNPEPVKSYVIDAVGFVCTTTGPATAQPYTMIAALFTAPAQAGLAAGYFIQSMSNGGPQSRLATHAAVTITAPTAPTWVPVCFDNNTVAGAQPMTVFGLNDNFKGRLIVPPGQGLGFNIMGGAGGLFAPFGWHVEKELDLE